MCDSSGADAHAEQGQRTAGKGTQVLKDSPEQTHACPLRRPGAGIQEGESSFCQPDAAGSDGDHVEHRCQRTKNEVCIPRQNVAEHDRGHHIGRDDQRVVDQREQDGDRQQPGPGQAPVQGPQQVLQAGGDTTPSGSEDGPLVVAGHGDQGQPHRRAEGQGGGRPEGRIVRGNGARTPRGRPGNRAQEEKRVESQGAIGDYRAHRVGPFADGVAAEVGGPDHVAADQPRQQGAEERADQRDAENPGIGDVDFARFSTAGVDAGPATTAPGTRRPPPVRSGRRCPG